jgi:tRNA(Arg) A34 adenosine deaminase TadA
MTYLTMHDENFMQIALNEAVKSPCNSQHGAVAVVKGNIIGRGYNHYRCNTRDGFVNNSCTCHAEMSAIRQAFHQVDKTHMYFMHAIKVA